MRKQIDQQRAEIASAIAAAQQARFQLAEAEDNRRDLIITAPFDGTVMTRAAEPGEVVTAGTAIVTLLDMSKVYLRGFVPGRADRQSEDRPARARVSRFGARPNRSMLSCSASIRRPRSRPRTLTSATTA